MNYEPPLSQPDKEPKPVWEVGSEMLFPGVRGYAMEHQGLIYIPLIVAEHKGNGDVGRFLDALSPRCRIVSVTNKRLQGMLERRGWTADYEMCEGDAVDIWKKGATPCPTTDNAPATLTPR